ncbi:CoA transferase [Rhodobacteraceae bacterium NNCM2]|nr:CoA transferase [Coraliihabitans acroporae]
MGALDGVKVIDLTRILGGPFCTQWLGDHGADVIKIEPPQGDDVRKWGPPFDEEIGAASYFLGVNRNKRGMALDLRMEEGREVLLRLLEEADVLIENFKAGSMEKWGIGYDTLKERFPRLIHCTITGFGDQGPMGGMPGYDAVIQAQAGLMSINGVKGGGPTRIGVPVVDISTGMSAAFAISMALHERHASGKGQHIDTTLYDNALAFLFPHYANYLLSGNDPRIVGNQHTNLAPYDAYPTRTCDVYVAGGNDSQWVRMCQVLGVPEAAEDPRFKTNADRIGHQAELRELVAPLTAEWEGEELAKALMKAGVPAGPVLATREVLAAEQTKAREMVVDIDGFKTVGNPVKMSRTPANAAGRKPPRFGQHTREVLAECGYDDAAIDRLIDCGAALTDGR